MLQLNTQTIPLFQGLDTKTDPKQLKLGKLTAISNLQFDEVGDLSPRNGYTALTQSIINTGSISAGRMLATLNSSLVLGDGTNLYSYAESLTKWAPKGLKVVLNLSTFAVTGAATNASVQDSALHSGGAAIYTWIDSSTQTMSYSVLDTATQATIVQQGGGYSATNAKPCVISTNSSYTIFLQNAGNLQYSSVTLANPAASTAASTLVAITSGSAPFDACTGSTFGYIFYVNSGGDIAVSRINTSNAVVNTATLTGQAATSLTCWYDTTNNYVWLMWYSGTVVKYAVYTSALVSVLATTSIVTASAVTRLTGSLTTGTTSTAWYETQATLDSDNFLTTYTLTAAGVATLVSSVRSIGLAGKAFTYSSSTYALAVHSSPLQSTYFVIQPLGATSYAQGTVVGKLAPLNAGGTPAIKTCGSVYATTTGSYAFCYLLQANPTTLSGVVQSTKSIQSAIFTFPQAPWTDSPIKLALANNLHISGALITNYDSGSSTEHGFNLFPELGEQVPISRLPLGGLGIGTYSYKVTYEWIDEFGQTHRSAPSTGLERLITAPTGSASDGGSDTRIDLIIQADATTPSRFVYPEVELTDLNSIFAANTSVTTIQDANSVNITPADVGGTFNTQTIFHSRKTFTASSSTTTLGGNVLSVTKPTVLYASSTLVSGSNQVFAAVTEGLVVGQAITDNASQIPGGTTITAFVYKNNGALLTLSANATASNYAIVNITHATGWPITQWLHKGQNITGTGIPVDTVITDIADSTSTTALVTLSEATTAKLAAATVTIKNYYTTSINLPTLRITEKGRVTQPVQIAVWRTAASGTQYYKVGYVVNDSTTDGVIFYDYTSDVDLVGNTPLYTNGGEVENIAPPASNFMTSFKNRTILLPSEDGYGWWYSKQVTEGSPVEFSDLFVQSIDQRGGPLVGASPMDDKLVFFKGKDIFYVVGDGPAPSGANNDFSYPQSVVTPCGCTEAKSIVTIPTGIIFKSAKGWYLLDRGLNVSYIGAEVEDYNSYTVRNATLTATGTQVRIALTSTDMLMYDYYTGQWSVFSNSSALDVAIYGNTFTYLQSGGLVYEETPGVYSDAGSVVIPTSFTTGWISFDKVQNYQRLWDTYILGQYYSPHTLVATIAYDFDDTVKQTFTIPLTSAVTPYQFKLPPMRQKCEAVKLKFTCTPASVAGQGASFSALTFEMGVKKGAFKLPATRTYGGAAS